jgi:CRP/FNR family transcriptional regulator, anaerobic regulatory protein
MNEGVTDKIEKFFSQYRVRKYAKGQVLILNGDGTDNVYNVVEGRVKQYDVTYRGDEIILNTFKPPAFFPMSLAINKTDNPYIYEAETEIEVRQAPADEVVEFLKANPDVVFDLLSRVYRGVDGLIGRMAHLMASSAKGRLMYELLIECRRFGKDQPDGSCVLEVNEKELGSRAGLSRETVSREMAKLIRDNFVSAKPGLVTVKNLSEFQTSLGQVI